MSAPEEISEAAPALTVDTELENAFASPPSSDAADDNDESPEIAASDSVVEDSAPEITSEIPELDADELDLGSEMPADLLDLEEPSTEAENVTTSAEASEAEDDSATVHAQSDVDDSEADTDADASVSAEDLGIDDAALGIVGGAAAVAGVGLAAQSAGDTETPDFAEKEIDTATLDREFEHETAEAKTTPTVTETEDGRVSLTFDDSRSTLLNHVSRQMDCSVEDVVVTALDWYLDALFGEEGDEAKSA